MTQNSIRIYGRDINPAKVFLIKAYDPLVLDLSKVPYDDINSVLVLARRPFRTLARRSVKTLAAALGFHYLPEDNLAINPRMHATVEAHASSYAIAGQIPPRSLLKITYHGITRSQLLTMAREDVQAILQPQPSRNPLNALARIEAPSRAL